MINSLPSFHEVFFVHYQCDRFNEGTQIYNMGIYSKKKVQEFADEEEHVFIEKYCAKVKALCTEGLRPVSWNQNRPYYGPDMIMKRYKHLTGKEIVLEYENEIILSDLLIEIYGDDYVAHPRLDSLAELNQCYGSSKENNCLHVFSANRLLLLTKIYHKLVHNKLVTRLTPTHNDTSIKAAMPSLDIIQADEIKQEPKTIIETRLDTLTEQLRQHGFFKIPKMKVLTSVNQQKLVELLLCNNLPYCIAMLDFLGYVNFLDKNYFKIIKSRNIELANWFESNERAVRGNVNILADYSDENSSRYTANKHKEKVEKDYNDIK